MSEKKLKTYLESIPKEEIIDIVLRLYNSRKDAKEYLSFFMNPNEKTRFEKAKKTIDDEFFRSRGKSRSRVTVCKKSITEFCTLGTSPEYQAKLMMHYVLQACKFASIWGIRPNHKPLIADYFTTSLNILETYHILSDYTTIIEQTLARLHRYEPELQDTLEDIYHSTHGNK